MSSSKSEDQQTDLLVDLANLQADINGLKEERKEVSEYIKALKEGERSPKTMEALTALEYRLGGIDARLAVYETKKERLEAQASSGTATAQQGK